MSEPGGSSSPADEPDPDKMPEGEVRRTNYNRIVRQARLVSIVLEKVNFDVSSDALSPSERQSLKRTISSNAELLSFDNEEGSCLAQIVWEIVFKKKRKTVLKCKASYIVVYDEIRDCSEELVKEFVESVGRPATYAYFRALYAHLDWSANLGSPPLPIMKFQPRV